MTKMAGGEGLFSRLSKTRKSLSTGLLGIFKGDSRIEDSLYEDIEDQLLMADIGAQTSQMLVSGLKEKSRKEKYTSSSQLLDGLKETMVDVFEQCQQDVIEPRNQGPHVILMVGVNGVGKTTTLAKMGHHYTKSGNKVMMAACDTFRAAAIEQLQSWGQKLDIPVIAQSHGSDAAAVAYDAYNAAVARNMDYLLIDSAGRQHTHGDLMDQLKKIRKVLGKASPELPQDVFITVDAGNGQNVISQVENFNNAIPLTGLCITKLDGTARGGVVISLAQKFKLPIKFIGVGEGAEDLRPFDAGEFVSALLPGFPEN
jgi:fused signal recognition particle receptor